MPFAAKGKFEVVAGGRRLAALRLLAKEKNIPAKQPVACNIIEGDATEISLAENVIRIPMHPADQYEAFKVLADEGRGQEEIAARFGTSPQIVRQRLKLASVSPRLMEEYRNDEMTLDQLMAFAISDDHAAQESAWFDQPQYNRRPSSIRSHLTTAQVEADDARAVFVTLDGYKAAGGNILRDLFDEDHEGYLTDSALLDRLVTQKLANEAASVLAEGWKWVETTPHLDYETRSRFGKIHAEQQPLTDEQQQELDRLTAEYDALLDEHGDDQPPEIVEKLDAISDRIDVLSEGSYEYRAEDIAIAGAIVTIDGNGGLAIYRGLVRAEDKPERTKAEGGEGRKAGAGQGGLSARLIEDLTAHRTAALRLELAARPDIALAATVHALALPLLYDHAFDVASCLDLRVGSRRLEGSAETLPGTEDGKKLAALTEGWSAKLPSEPKDLFAWLVAQETATLLDLLATCAAMSIDAVRCKSDRADSPRLSDADRLAATVALDMADHWQPTKAGYFGRVSKAIALDAVREGVSAQAADNLADLKRDALAEAAEGRMAGSRWLPSVLR